MNSRWATSLTPACLALGIGLLSAQPAAAQCGYGTSPQDCQHQQRDTAAREEADRHYRDGADQGQGAQGAGYVDSASSSGGPVPWRWVTAFAATAVHPDARDVWAVWDARGSFEQASQQALAACTQAMGPGCAAGASVQGGSVAAARDQNGYMWTHHGRTPDEAKAAVQALCVKNDQRCEVVRTVTAKHWEEVATTFLFDRTKTAFPTRGAALAKSAAVAWPKVGNARWAGKAWLVTGVEGLVQAQQRAVANCHAATGVECIVGRYVVGTNFVHYRTDKGVDYWTGLLDRSAANRFVGDVCKTYGDTCKVIATYDASRPLEQMIAEGK